MATLNWIKVRNNLLTHPKIVRISSALCLPPVHILGACVHLWSVADAHADGEMLPGMDENSLDSMVQIPGFAREMIKVGWISINNDSMQLVNYQTHNGTSAKRRAEDAGRKRTERGQNADEVQTKIKNKNKNKNKIIDNPPNPPDGGNGIQTQLTQAPVEKRSKEYDPHTATLPRELDTPEFRSVWIEWFDYRKERKIRKLTSKSIEAKLNEMTAWGSDVAAAQIRKSIANGWQGIFAPGPESGKSSPAVKGFAAVDRITQMVGQQPSGDVPLKPITNLFAQKYDPLKELKAQLEADKLRLESKGGNP